MATPVLKFTSRDWAMALTINIVWGLNLIAVKYSVGELPPMTAALLRMTIVFVICLPFLRVVPGQMTRLLVLGLILGGVFMALVNLSVMVTRHVSALAIASQLGAPFSLILAVIFLRERIGMVRIIGIALSFLGCALLVFDPHAGREWPGLLLTAAASFVWACASLIQRNLIGVRIMTIYAWIGLGGVVVLAPLALIFDHGSGEALNHISPITMGALCWSAIASTLIGAGGLSWLLQRHPVSAVVPLTLGAPIVAVSAATILFHTPLTPLMILGGVLALAGVAIVSLRTAEKSEALGAAEDGTGVDHIGIDHLGVLPAAPRAGMRSGDERPSGHRAQ